MFQRERRKILNSLEKVVNRNLQNGEGVAPGLERRLKEAFGTNRIQDIADRLEMSYQGVDHLIKGRRKLHDVLLIRISRLTNCSIHWLLTGVGPKQVIDSDVSSGALVVELDSRSTLEDEELSSEEVNESEEISPQIKEEIRRQIIQVLKYFPRLSEKDRKLADALVKSIALTKHRS